MIFLCCIKLSRSIESAHVRSLCSTGSLSKTCNLISIACLLIPNDLLLNFLTKNQRWIGLSSFNQSSIRSEFSSSFINRFRSISELSFRLSRVETHGYKIAFIWLVVVVHLSKTLSILMISCAMRFILSS